MLLEELIFSPPKMEKHFYPEQAKEEQYSYAIVEGAGTDKVLMYLETYNPESRILYYPDEAEDLEEAAPWLIKLNQGDAFTNWLLEDCFNKRLLLFIQSTEEIDTLAEHFRYYTKAEVSNDKDDWDVVYFSFYDPTTFSTWVKSLTKEEATRFFEPISNVWYEEGNEQLTLLYMAQDGWKHKAHSLIKDIKKPTKNKTEAV